MPCAPAGPCGPPTLLCATVFLAFLAFLVFLAFLAFFLPATDEAVPCLTTLVAAKALVAMTVLRSATRTMTGTTRPMRSLRIRDMS